MSTTVAPRPGYPFWLDVSVCYRLGDKGLEGQPKSSTRASAPARSATASILPVGRQRLDRRLPAPASRHRPDLTDDRQLPAGREEVSGTKFDFAEPCQLWRHRDRLCLHRPASRRGGEGLDPARGCRREDCVDLGRPELPAGGALHGHTLAPDRARTGLGTEPMSSARMPSTMARGDPARARESASAVWGACPGAEHGAPADIPDPWRQR